MTRGPFFLVLAFGLALSGLSVAQEPEGATSQDELSDAREPGFVSFRTAFTDNGGAMRQVAFKGQISKGSLLGVATMGDGNWVLVRGTVAADGSIDGTIEENKAQDLDESSFDRKLGSFRASPTKTGGLSVAYLAREDEGKRDSTVKVQAASSPISLQPAALAQ